MSCLGTPRNGEVVADGSQLLDIIFAVLPRLPQIQSLHLHTQCLTIVHLSSLHHLPSLKWLEIRSPESPEEDFVWVSPPPRIEGGITACQRGAHSPADLLDTQKLWPLLISPERTQSILASGPVAISALLDWVKERPIGETVQTKALVLLGLRSVDESIFDIIVKFPLVKRLIIQYTLLDYVWTPQSFITRLHTFLESNPLPHLNDINLPFELVIPFLENFPIKNLHMTLCDDPAPALTIVNLIKDCHPQLTSFSATAVHNPLVWVKEILVNTKIEVLQVGLVLNTDEAGIVVVNKLCDLLRSSSFPHLKELALSCIPNHPRPRMIPGLDAYLRKEYPLLQSVQLQDSRGSIEWSRW
ncbi:hypothetical protein NLI96_g9162 [Meripilus lineatus]|uniref:Uncharacterized protein n=1 Tax=Meripilus lineatus TaxID=2056292 RepID=A0AAD5UXQ0_9APHY|nr:hypothetical protein NLI96_g9162 [Physisporinus lineatus]